ARPEPGIAAGGAGEEPLQPGPALGEVAEERPEVVHCCDAQPVLVLAGAVGPRQRGAGVVQFEFAGPGPCPLVGADQACFGALIKCGNPGEMPVPAGVLVPGGGEALQGVLADGLQHPETGRLAARLCDEQGLLHQGRDQGWDVLVTEWPA